jgi:hypothetical protein
MISKEQVFCPRRISWFVAIFLLASLTSCRDNGLSVDNTGAAFASDFDNTNDRIWVGRDFWTIPMEDWRVQNGRLECTGTRPNMRANILTRSLEGPGDLTLSVRAGVLQKNGDAGSTAGFRIGLQDDTDNDLRSLCYFGQGIDVGIHTDGFIFINEDRTALPEDFDWTDVEMSVAAQPREGAYSLTLQATDAGGRNAELVVEGIDGLQGAIALVNNHATNGDFTNGTQFWFDDLEMNGALLKNQEEASFGPILWSMYTLSRGTMKMTAQMPPLGEDDEHKVQLQIRKGQSWETVAEEEIQPAARIAVFRIEDWDATRDYDYRLVYDEQGKDGGVSSHQYEGIVRRDPVDRPLRVGGLTCQNGYGFPYRPLLENLVREEPDLLFFSGDQIYEGNGGYPIIRFPADRAILNYLGKWYMFGWAFGDLMRDRPTICLPDDHEVYQGNLWGEGGKKVTLEEWNASRDARSGFVQPVEMVNVVTRTNCAHLPDPYDPTPMNGEFEVYYTDLVYGRVSFAIVADRFYKSGPERVAFWKEGRKDHIKEEFDPSLLERPELQFLGDRQLAFLEEWTQDWRGADLKALLSQTIFANAATHHGAEKMFLYGDMDSGGWPKAGRDEAVDLMRKAFAFHICGDQHVPLMVQYGVDEYRDAGWVFCTPAIATGYERRVLHDQLGNPVTSRPDHGLPNTGYYTDFFNNPNYVYAVANPVEDTRSVDRYQRAQNRVSGFGMIHFDQQERTITSEAFPFLASTTENGELEQFPGWPLTIAQLDNYGREAVVYLPEIRLSGAADLVVQITEEKTGDLVYAVRMAGDRFQPKVFAAGSYQVKAGDPDTGRWQLFEGVQAVAEPGSESLDVVF